MILSRMLGMPVSKGKGADTHNPSSSGSGGGDGQVGNKNALQRTLQAFAKAQQQGVDRDRNIIMHPFNISTQYTLCVNLSPHYLNSSYPVNTPSFTPS